MLAIIYCTCSSTVIAVICSGISSACLIRITRSRGLRILCRWFCGIWLIWFCRFRIRRLWIWFFWICRLRRCGICWLWIRLTLIPSTRGRYWIRGIWCRWFTRIWIYWLCRLYILLIGGFPISSLLVAKLSMIN